MKSDIRLYELKINSFFFNKAKTAIEMKIEQKSIKKKAICCRRKAEMKLEQTIALYDETMFKLHAEMKGTEEGFKDEFQQLQLLLV
jgi:hypothetical protein